MLKNVIGSGKDAWSEDREVGQQQGARHGQRHQHHHRGVHALVGLGRL